MVLSNLEEILPASMSNLSAKLVLTSPDDQPERDTHVVKEKDDRTEKGNKADATNRVGIGFEKEKKTREQGTDAKEIRQSAEHRLCQQKVPAAVKNDRDSQVLGKSHKDSQVSGNKNRDSQASDESNTDKQALSNADKDRAKRMPRLMESDAKGRLEKLSREKHEQTRPESRQSSQSKSGCGYMGCNSSAREQTRMSSFQTIHHSLEETKVSL